MKGTIKAGNRKWGDRSVTKGKGAKRQRGKEREEGKEGKRN